MPRITRSMSYAAGLLPVSQPKPISHKPPVIGDLPDVIHPIFARKKFSKDVDYELIRPALVLATKLISTPALLSYWHTVFHSEIKPAEHVLYSKHENDNYMEYCEHLQDLNEEQIAKTQNQLLHFPYWVCFVTPPRNTVSIAPLENLNMCTWLMENERVGKCAVIQVSRVSMAELREGAAFSERHGDPIFYALDSFIFAKTLVHELAHAVRLVVRGHGSFFLPHQAASEDGFDWEETIFGGHLATHLGLPPDGDGRMDFTAKPRPLASIDPWPGTQLICSYLSGEHPLGLRLADGRPILTLQGTGDFVGGLQRLWDCKDIERMFTQAFWDEDVVVNGVEAFRLAKPGGHLAAFPRSWVRPLLELYEKRTKTLEQDLEKAEVDGDSAKLDYLRKLQEHLDAFYDAWNEPVDSDLAYTVQSRE